MDFLSRRPVSFFIQWRRDRQTFENALFRSVRHEQTFAIGHSLSLRGLPKIKMEYHRTHYTTDARLFSRQFNLQRYVFDLQHHTGMNYWEVRSEWNDFDDPRWRDTLRIQGRWKWLPGPGRSWRMGSGFYFHKIGDLRSLTGFWNRTSPSSRWSFNFQSSWNGGFSWTGGQLRFEQRLSSSIWFRVEPGYWRQNFRGGGYRETWIQPSVTIETAIQGWNVVMIPSLRITRVEGSGQQELGYRTGLSLSTEKAMSWGRLRLQTDVSVDDHPILPSYRRTVYGAGLHWYRQFGGLSFEVHSFHRWERYRSEGSFVNIYHNDSGMRVSIPRWRVQLEGRIADMVWNELPYRRRYLALTLSPLEIGPIRAELYEQLEFVDEQTFNINRVFFRWRVGQITVALVSSLYQSWGGPDARNWWDIRLVVQRPLTLFSRPLLR